MENRKRYFLIRTPEDCEYLNQLLKNLENEKLEYNTDWDYKEGMPGILVMVSIE